MGNFAPYSTDCSKCIFYAEQRCGANLWEKYREHNIKIIDGMLNNFHCPYYRSQDWLKVENLFKIIEKENELNYSIVLNRPNYRKIAETINTINKFTVKPKRVYFYVDGGLMKFNNKLVSLLKKRAAFLWKVCAELRPNTWFNLISNCNRNDFILYGDNLPNLRYDWANEVHDIINKNLETVGYFNIDNAILLPPYVYNSFYFEYTTKCLDKIKEQLCPYPLSVTQTNS